MFLFNLSLAEFLALFSGLSVAVTALYLLDRSRQKHRVPTLRFWTHADAPAEMQHRRKIQQPWSLLLQILSLGLLLLAIAQLRWGSPLDRARDHVLILDTSAVMAAQSNGRSWIDEARTLARSWLAKIPPGDRVMLVRADALPTAVTAFETNRRVVEEAISASQPSSSGLRLDAALKFASQAASAGKRGEIAYVGPGRYMDEESPSAVPGLRVLPVKGAFENAGIRKVGLRRSGAGGRDWEAFVTVRNDGLAPRIVPVALLLGGAPVAQRRLTVPPGGQQSFTVNLQTSAAGVLETRIQGRDAFALDDRAAIELPSQMPLRVAVFSSQPELLRPLLTPAPRIEAIYRPPNEYSPDADAAVVILDRFAGAPPKKAAAIWIDPPRSGSPVAVASRPANVAITSWRNDHPLGAGLKARDVRLESASVFETKAGDVVIAETQAGPLIVARPSLRGAVIGFHPMLTSLRFELTTPLLFANLFRWLAPELFLTTEVTAGSAGSVSVPLDFDVNSQMLQATSDTGGPVPYTINGRTLRFFAGEPGVVRFQDGQRELVYSLTLPEVAAASWTIPAGVAQGVPEAIDGGPASRDLWHWLAVLGGLGLLAEWILFGRARRLFRTRSSAPAAASLRRAS
jgi:hypothetical protein